jgi:putative hydrolase
VPDDHPRDPRFGGSGDEPDPFSAMFGGMFGGMFGDMMKMFQGQGPIQWDTARQIAQSTATSGRTENNIDPRVRIDFENLARIAAMQVHMGTGIGDVSNVVDVVPDMVTPGQWAQRTLDDYRPLFTDLATALGSSASNSESSDGDPFAGMFANLTNMLAPMTMGMTVGSMVGLIAKRSLGQYDLPLPRPTGSRLALLADNIDAFATEWDLAIDDVRMWTLVREIVTHQLYGIAHIRDEVTSLISAHVAAFRPDPTAISDKLSSIESSDPSEMMMSLQKILGDPELLLGAVRTPEQDRLRPRLDTILSVVIGWSDYMTDLVGAKVLGNPGRIAEAARRRRVDGGEETKFVERLLGVHVERQRVEAGRAFVDGVIQRAGVTGLTPLYTNAASLPTPAELEAPGLWLARMEFVNGD